MMALTDCLYPLARRFLFALDPERAHELTLAALARWPAGKAPADDPKSLSISLFGLDFQNPVGLAAGFDKNGVAPDALLGFGFGFVEVGTVTPLPQAGNPRPRLFRLVEDEAVINRMGFNNAGLVEARARLSGRAGKPGLVGANVGANKDSADRIADYAAGVAALAPLAAYVTINISSPNTPGLRLLQARDQLEALIRRCQAARGAARTPLLVKIAPDLADEDLADVAAVALACGVDGLIVGNTTLARPETLRSALAGEAGGLSGRPLLAPSTGVLRAMYRLTAGRCPLVGVGGIASGADAYAKIRAGASLVQLYSALVYRGPGLVQAIKRDLAACLARDGFGSIREAVGVDAR